MLCRYRSFAGRGSAYLERMIVHRELYFSAPIKFNDPFDCRPVFSVKGTDRQVRDYCDRVVSKHMPNLSRERRRAEVREILSDPLRNPCSPQATSALQAAHTKRVTEQVGVLCLSAVADNILMWAHYSDAHQGVCVIFDPNVDFFLQAQNVQYPKFRPHINPICDTEEEMMTSALLTKSDHWAYEKEWRIIHYQRGPGTYVYPQGALVGVVLGAQISPINEALIRKWIGEIPIPAFIYRASPSAIEFRVEIKREDY